MAAKGDSACRARLEGLVLLELWSSHSERGGNLVAERSLLYSMEIYRPLTFFDHPLEAPLAPCNEMFFVNAQHDRICGICMCLGSHGR